MFAAISHLVLFRGELEFWKAMLVYIVFWDNTPNQNTGSCDN